VEELPTNAKKFIRIAHGTHPCRAFIFHAPTPGPMWVKLGTEKLTKVRLIHAKFHPIGATCRPCEARNLKIAPE